MKRRNSSETKTVRHSHEREPPLPIYMGLNVHTQTRSKTLVNTLYRLGLSISYNRVEELANGLATAVYNHFQEDGLVCPLNQRFGLFTTGAIDNLDHDPSLHRQGCFHGTSISLFQHPSKTQYQRNVKINNQSFFSIKYRLFTPRKAH